MRKNKSKLVIIISIIVILSILIGAVTFLYFTTDLFKSNEELFFKYALQNGQMLSKYIEETNQDRINNIKQNKHTTDATITFDLVSSDAEVANQTIPLRNFSINYKSQVDPLNKKDSSQSILKYMDTNLLELNYAHNADLYGITSSEVINKYLTFENNNLKELAEEYGADTTTIPNKFESQYYSELFNISEEDSKYIMEAIISLVKNEISKDQYYSNKDITILVDNQQIKANCYGISLTGEQCKNFILNVLNKCSEDERILNIILNKIRIINSEAEITIQDLKDIISNLLIDDEDTNNMFQGLKIEFYTSDGKIVKTILETENEDAITLDYQTTDTAVRTIISFEYANQDNAIGNISNAKIKNIEIAKETKLNEKNDIIIVTFGMPDNKIFKLSFQNKISLPEQSQAIIKNVIININDADTTYITIRAKGTTTPDENIVVQELTSDNIARINNFTPEYAFQLLDAIVKRITTIFEQKLQAVQTTMDLTTLINNNQNSNEQTSVNSNTITTQNENIMTATNTINEAETSIWNNLNNNSNSINENR